MRKKNISLIVASSLVLLWLIFQAPTGTQLNLQIVKPVKANPNTIWVPDNYTAIQEAVNNANEGETIFVRADTYYEHVVINKTMLLVGENPSTTIVDGNGTGIVVRINAPNVEIRGFTIQNGGVSPDSGIIVGSCIGDIIRDNIIRNNAYGVRLSGSNECSIINNTIIDNSPWAGIHILDSSNNDIYENTIAYNTVSVWITSSSSLLNTFYRNNFIDNVNQPWDFSNTTAWDNGTEGNYWGDYTGIDTDGDGVGNTAHVMALVTDNYPLIIPTKPFPVVVDDAIYFVAMLSNVTISWFSFIQANKTIFFNVTGPPGAVGFCNVTIPKDLMNFLLDDWRVKVDGATPTYFPPPTDNDTHTFVYFEFNVTVTPPIQVLVLPEFAVVLIMPLFIILTMVAAVLRKSKKETSES